MLKKILMAVGIAKSPSPIRKFIGAKAFFGTIPALGYVGWRYRGKIASLFRRGSDHGRGELTAHGDRQRVISAST